MNEREPSRGFHNPQLHLPIGQKGYYEIGGRSMITNALPHRVTATPVLNPEGPELSRMLNACGFNLGENDVNSRVKEAKFVFMKDGTFFLGHGGLVHTDLPMAIGSYDRVAVLSAGFCRLYPDKVELFGRSESLDREVCLFVPYDRKTISDHLEIPFELMTEEELD